MSLLPPITAPTYLISETGFHLEHSVSMTFLINLLAFVSTFPVKSNSDSLRWGLALGSSSQELHRQLATIHNYTMNNWICIICTFFLHGHCTVGQAVHCTMPGSAFTLTTMWTVPPGVVQGATYTIVRWSAGSCLFLMLKKEKVLMCLDMNNNNKRSLNITVALLHHFLKVWTEVINTY